MPAEEKLEAGWKVKGVYNEACAAEGTCPLLFQRDRSEGCRAFGTWRITEAKINGIDLSGISVIYVVDLPYSTYKDVVEKGSVGAIYISDNATPKQRGILDTLVVEHLQGPSMRKIHAVKYVHMDIYDDKKTFRIKMPFGEMEMHATVGLDGTPIRIENTIFDWLSDLKACHTSFWNFDDSFDDYAMHFNYKNRWGSWANFNMKDQKTDT